MKIYFATSACSKSTYSKIFKIRNKKIIDPAQKFFEQIMSGIAQNNNVNVVSFTALPVSASTVRKKLFRKSEELKDGIHFIYPPFINGGITRFLTIFLSVFFIALKKFYQEKEKVVVICDPLCVQIAKPIRLAAKIWGIKSVAVVTDIPYWATDMKKSNCSKIRHFAQKTYESFCMRETKSYDGYICLTKYMVPIVNPLNKPSVIIEGSAVFPNTKDENFFHESKKIVMYAGGVYEKYGINMLVNGFLKANLSNVELHIYGDGSFTNHIKKIAQIYPNIKYMGVALNTDLPEIESKSSLLVNPRFTNEEYTKFSFPSKTLEYMSSGTPVLSTKLKGIPDDYKPYLFWLDKETDEGMAETLRKIFKHNQQFLMKFGLNAKNFVKEQKNNIVQGKKILDFIEMIC